MRAVACGNVAPPQRPYNTVGVTREALVAMGRRWKFGRVAEAQMRVVPVPQFQININERRVLHNTAVRRLQVGGT